MKDERKPDDKRYTTIFRPWITDPKTGEKKWARTDGKRAFPIRVPID